MTNLLGEPPETFLPADSGAAAIDAGDDVQSVAATHPDSTLAWSLLAEAAFIEGRDLEGYAFARTAYHRSLDALRRNGWKGFGPVPYSHQPNRGFLRCVAALAKAADSIGETDEYQRCLDLLDDCDPAARSELGL